MMRDKKWCVTWAFYNHGDLDGNEAWFSDRASAKRFLAEKHAQADALEPELWSMDQAVALGFRKGSDA